MCPPPPLGWWAVQLCICWFGFLLVTFICSSTYLWGYRHTNLELVLISLINLGSPYRKQNSRKHFNNYWENRRWEIIKYPFYLSLEESHSMNGFLLPRKQEQKKRENNIHMTQKIIFKTSYFPALTCKKIAILLMVCESLITDKCSC